MSTQTIGVAGMTCDHCVRAVTQELTKIAGVARVEVDLVNAVVTVTSDRPIDSRAVVAAVEDAGYEVRT